MKTGCLFSGKGESKRIVIVRAGGCPVVVGQLSCQSTGSSSQGPWARFLAAASFSLSSPPPQNKQAVFIVHEYLTGLHKIYEPHP